MSTHALRCWPAYFEAVASGEKTFEVRWDDRGFQAGDEVVLHEWDRDRACDCRRVSVTHLPGCARYTGRAVTARIGYVLAQMHSGNRRPFSGEGYVVFSLCDVQLVQVSLDEAALRRVVDGHRRPSPCDMPGARVQVSVGDSGRVVRGDVAAPAGASP